MTLKVGSTDRIVRIVLGVAALGAGYYYQSWFGLIGLVLIGTALINWCPLYLPFGINTRGKKA